MKKLYIKFIEGDEQDLARVCKDEASDFDKIKYPFEHKNWITMSMEKSTPKYFVIVKGKSAPTRIHNSLQEAQDEAKRLSKLEGRNTYVVEIKNKYGSEIKELTF